jgi:uncharacterized integral membrane protein
MPWKFILFIILCILFSIFIGFNLGYTGTIDFLVVKVEEAPIFLVVLFSFFTGVSVGLLATVFRRSKKRIKEKREKKDEREAIPEENGAEQGSIPENRRSRKRK